MRAGYERPPGPKEPNAKEAWTLRLLGHSRKTQFILQDPHPIIPHLVSFFKWQTCVLLLELASTRLGLPRVFVWDYDALFKERGLPRFRCLKTRRIVQSNRPCTFCLGASWPGRKVCLAGFQTRSTARFDWKMIPRYRLHNLHLEMYSLRLMIWNFKRVQNVNLRANVMTLSFTRFQSKHVLITIVSLS